jgi:hypothetical protein
LRLNTHQQGRFAEHLVAAHLCELGHEVSLAPASVRYDLIAVINGKIYRVQVKSAAKASRECRYIFYVGKNAQYNKGDFDLVACVALDIKTIAFLAPHYLENKGQVSLRPSAASRSSGRKRDFTIIDCPLEKALKEIG